MFPTNHLRGALRGRFVLWFRFGFRICWGLKGEAFGIEKFHGLVYFTVQGGGERARRLSLDPGGRGEGWREMRRRRVEG